ncbi:putative membrane protein [Terriglobus roseus DSM 18391]|uniref:Putative membrane protein n=1 Tax=Terriglobus roseus (strain DSM 18391 / NRRL B-41598 / KBS 63) TaxID=926566 RepID=I3ZB21_TERRK|nr:hypothetical protein [Terriglobus roseus]AFL86439.1 putative membrane protein [Terriglobus roseus DSM 18391]
MSTNPPHDPELNSSGAEPVYGPAYTAAAGTETQTTEGEGRRSSGERAVAPEAEASREARTQSATDEGSSPPYTAPYPPYPYDPPPAYGLQPNLAAGLAYMTLVPAVFFLLVEPYKSNRLVRFHSFQSIFFFLAVAALHAIENVLDALLPVVMAYSIISVVSLVWLATWLVAVVQAFGGKPYQLPWIGRFAEKASSGATL